MMQTPWLDKIREIIAAPYTQKIERDSNYHFELEETGKEATCKKALLKAISDMSVHKFDEPIKNIDALFPFFEEGSANAMCDYILFYAYENELHQPFCFLINMKSGQEKNNKDQLEAGFIFGQFLGSNAIRMFNKGIGEGDAEYMNNEEIIFVKIAFRKKKPLHKPFVKNGSSLNNKIEEFECENQRCDLDVLCQKYNNKRKKSS